MEETKYFLTQAKRTNGTISKGCAIYNTKDDGQQGYFAYLSAYAFGHEAGTDYVFVVLYDSNGMVIEPARTWSAETPESNE